ncbi:proton-coupled folate transporter-like [Lineus longissimus]|uniref:proton-coupled folate transporter-like n=1 Tax=Lineus longissimus TaxID=88925 RepID=UPI002B4F256E
MDQEEEKPLIRAQVRRSVSYSDTPTPASPDVLDEKTIPGFPKIIVPKRRVVIEPVLFLYCLALVGSLPIMSQYLYARFEETYPILINGTQNENTTEGKGCQHVNLSDPIFIATQSVQSETSKWQMYLQVTSSLINVVTTILYGAYSDAAGRRIVLILPAAAMTIKFIINCFIIYFDLPVYYFLIGQVFDGLGGGFATMMMAVFAYIADITTPEQRGMRIAIAEACLAMSLAISQLAIGYFIRATGYFYPFLSLTIILLLNMLYLSCFVPETVVKQRARKFSLTASLKQTYTTYAEKDDRRNIKVVLLTLAILVFSFPIGSKFQLQILFTMNVPLCWSSVEIGIYMGITALVLQFGGLIGLKCFKMCKIPEIWIAVIGCLSWMASSLVNAWADTMFLMLMVCLVGIFLMAGVPMYRTIISRLVRPDEQGKVFAGVACVEAIASLVSSVVMNEIYQKTLYFMRGFIFLVAAFFGLGAMIITLVYICFDRATGGKTGRHHVIVNDSESAAEEER